MHYELRERENFVSEARASILQLMNDEIASARVLKKPNHPVLKNLEVSMEKRGKLLGIGGINLKRITSKTGQFMSSYISKNQNGRKFYFCLRCYNTSGG